MKVTIRIKLINRFKPAGIPDYKKKRSMKRPVYARCCPEDDLNNFVKTINIDDPDRLIEQLNEEIQRINDVANFQVKNAPNYGDKLIGEIDGWDFNGFNYKCFIPVSSNVNSLFASIVDPVEDKKQLKIQFEQTS